MRDGGGCASCPVDECAAEYRGSRCSALRDRYGLGDPKTRFDEIKTMSVEEMADELRHYVCPTRFGGHSYAHCEAGCKKCWLEFLQSPVEADK